jgi:hypothetical protein
LCHLFYHLIDKENKKERNKSDKKSC